LNSYGTFTSDTGTLPTIVIKSGVVDSDSLNPDPEFQVNPDPDPIRIQGFDYQKSTEKIQLIFFFLFLIKNCYLLILASIKAAQATEEAFSPPKRTSSTSKNEI
jgi:hypothetical protein